MGLAKGGLAFILRLWAHMCRWCVDDRLVLFMLLCLPKTLQCSTWRDLAGLGKELSMHGNLTYLAGNSTWRTWKGTEPGREIRFAGNCGATNRSCGEMIENARSPTNKKRYETQFAGTCGKLCCTCVCVFRPRRFPFVPAMFHHVLLFESAWMRIHSTVEIQLCHISYVSLSLSLSLSLPLYIYIYIYIAPRVSASATTIYSVRWPTDTYTGGKGGG